MTGTVLGQNHARSLARQSRGDRPVAPTLRVGAFPIAFSRPTRSRLDIRASRGAFITGDEPFYLVTTQSLLSDGDLDLQ